MGAVNFFAAVALYDISIKGFHINTFQPRSYISYWELHKLQAYADPQGLVWLIQSEGVPSGGILLLGVLALGVLVGSLTRKRPN